MAPLVKSEKCYVRSEKSKYSMKRKLGKLCIKYKEENDEGKRLVSYREN